MLCLALLCGCQGDAAQFRYEDYNTRLARSLKVEAADFVDTVAPARRPRKRDMLQASVGSTISMIDFLKLYHCKLGEVIGERNSVLGKVAPDSQRLFNDLAFLQHAPECIEQLQAEQNDDLAEKLIEANASKRASLAASIANATLASDEFSGLWRVPDALGEYPSTGGSVAINDLNYIAAEVDRWLSGDFTHDPERFEKALGRLRYGGAGSLLASATLTYSQLVAANRLVSSRLEQRPLCYQGKPSGQGRIFRRVVDRFFVGDIQVWLSRVNAQRYDLMEPYLRMEKQLEEVQSPAYRQWRLERSRQLAWLSSAPREHVRTILPLLESCGLAPGSPQAGE